jgi:LysR family carnitine catabolism transcriptional activator
MSTPRPRTTRSINLSIKHLRAAREVAKAGSFTAAAIGLAMTQPGVSRLISQLERDIGVSLFLRSTRKVALTPAGSEFIESIDRFLSDLDLQVANARGIGGNLRGRLVISCLLSLTHHMVPNTLLSYRKQNPGVEVHLREGLGSEVLDDVRSGIADFGIGNASGLPDDIVAENVIQESCVAVVSKHHALARIRSVTLRDLTREPLVSLPLASGLRRLIDGVAATQGITLNHMTIVEQFGSMFDFISAGLGLGIVPPSALPGKLPARLKVRPITSPAIVRQIGILRSRDRPLTPPAQIFLALFRPCFARAISKGR